MRLIGDDVSFVPERVEADNGTGSGVECVLSRAGGANAFGVQIAPGLSSTIVPNAVRSRVNVNTDYRLLVGPV